MPDKLLPAMQRHPPQLKFLQLLTIQMFLQAVISPVKSVKICRQLGFRFNKHIPGPLDDR
jgi:hypothetical protein